MPTVSVTTAFNVDLDFELAPFHKRLFAYLIDLTILVIYLFAMKSVLYDFFNVGFESHMGLDILLISIPMLFYPLITELLMNGQTPGKRLMQIRVISLHGGEATASQYILRWVTRFFEWPFVFGYIISAFIATYIFVTMLCGIVVVITILITAKSQRLGDIIAGTTLVSTKTSLSVEDTVFMELNTDNYKVGFPEVMRLSDNDINTMKGVLRRAQKSHNYDMCVRIESRIKEVLNISSALSASDFLEKLLEDYNYLATKEN